MKKGGRKENEGAGVSIEGRPGLGKEYGKRGGGGGFGGKGRLRLRC